MRPHPAGDTGGIVVGWLTKLVAAFAVVGVLAFDGVSLGVAHLGVTDAAAAAARVAAAEVASGSPAQAAYDAVRREVAEGQGSTEVPARSFVVGADGSVSVTVERTVPTLVLHHLPRSERWLTVSATSTRPGT